MSCVWPTLLSVVKCTSYLSMLSHIIYFCCSFSVLATPLLVEYEENGWLVRNPALANCGDFFYRNLQNVLSYLRQCSAKILFLSVFLGYKCSDVWLVGLHRVAAGCADRHTGHWEYHRASAQWAVRPLCLGLWQRRCRQPSTSLCCFCV